MSTQGTIRELTGSPVSLVCTPGLGGSQSGCQCLEQSSLSGGRSELRSLEGRSQVNCTPSSVHGLQYI